MHLHEFLSYKNKGTNDNGMKKDALRRSLPIFLH